MTDEVDVFPQLDPETQARVDDIRARRVDGWQGPPRRPMYDDEHGPDELTPREIEVLIEVAYGNSNEQIAARLGITVETVKAHVRAVLATLPARNRANAVLLGVSRGLIDPDPTNHEGGT